MSRQQFAIVVSTGLLTVTLLLTAPMQAADEKNPFALWERLKSKTEASETTVGTPKPAFGDRLTTTSHAPKATVQKPQIAYFSASAKDESSTDAAEKPSPKSDGAKQLKKERLAVKTPEKTETQAAVEPTPSAPG